MQLSFLTPFFSKMATYPSRSALPFGYLSGVSYYSCSGFGTHKRCKLPQHLWHKFTFVVCSCSPLPTASVASSVVFHSFSGLTCSYLCVYMYMHMWNRYFGCCFCGRTTMLSVNSKLFYGIKCEWSPMRF